MTTMLILAASLVAADDVPGQVIRTYNQRACTVRVHDGGGVYSRGSGVDIGDGWVLTAGHVVDDAVTRKVTIVFPRGAGGEYQGTVVGHVDRREGNDHIDMALIQYGRKRPRIAMRDPKVGEQVYAIGVPGRSTDLKMSRGRLVSTREWSGISPRSGMSGGPVFASDGCYVGTLWGGGGGIRGGMFTRCSLFSRLFGGRAILPWNVGVDRCDPQTPIIIQQQPERAPRTPDVMPPFPETKTAPPVSEGCRCQPSDTGVSPVLPACRCANVATPVAASTREIHRLVPVQWAQ